MSNRQTLVSTESLRADSPPPARLMPVAEPRPRWFASRGSIATLAIAAALIAFAGFAALAETNRRAALRESRMTAQALATALAEHTKHFVEVGTLIADEAIALTGGRAWNEVGAARDVFASLQRLEQRYPQVSAIWLADESGVQRLSSRGFPPRAESIAAQPAFVAHQKADSGPMVSRIVEERAVSDDATGASRTVREAALALSERINAGDGTFRGIVSVVLDPQELKRASTGTAPYPLTFELFAADGTVLLREPGAADERAEGERAVDPQQLHAAPEAAVVATGTLRGGNGRLIAYQAVGDLPLYVGVGVAAADALAEWRRATVREAGFLAAALSLVLLFMAIAAARTGSEARLRARMAALQRDGSA